MSMIEQQNSVVAPLKFLKWQDLYEAEKPYEFFVDVPEGQPDVPQNNLVFHEVLTTITDVRGSQETFKLETHGFQFSQFTSKLHDSDLENRRSVEEVYLPEVEDFLREEYPDAEKIFFFDWRIRKQQPPNHGPLDLNNRVAYLRPATEVHIDQSPNSVLQRIRLQLPSQAEQLLKCRVRIVNVWRPLIDAIVDWPLALCDARTVHGPDLIECDHIRKHYSGSTLYVLHRESLRWYYYSRQDSSTATVFKIFDSAPDAIARAVPHSSFELPDCPPEAEPRRSIEVRALIFTPE